MRNGLQFPVNLGIKFFELELDVLAALSAMIHLVIKSYPTFPLVSVNFRSQETVFRKFEGVNIVYISR